MTESADRHRRVRALSTSARAPPAAQPAALAAACAGTRRSGGRRCASRRRGGRGSFLEHGAAPALADAGPPDRPPAGPLRDQGHPGAGGMGEVYRARDTKLGRDVALKLLPALFAADPDRVARFRREAQILASLNHPHIAAIYGLEESVGAPALVLELVEGPTLATVSPAADSSRRGGANCCPDGRSARSRHAQGVVHRD